MDAPPEWSGLQWDDAAFEDDLIDVEVPSRRPPASLAVTACAPTSSESFPPAEPPVDAHYYADLHRGRVEALRAQAASLRSGVRRPSQSEQAYPSPAQSDPPPPPENTTASQTLPPQVAASRSRGKRPLPPPDLPPSRAPLPQCDSRRVSRRVSHPSGAGTSTDSYAASLATQARPPPPPPPPPLRRSDPALPLLEPTTASPDRPSRHLMGNVSPEHPTTTNCQSVTQRWLRMHAQAEGRASLQRQKSQDLYAARNARPEYVALERRLIGRHPPSLVGSQIAIHWLQGWQPECPYNQEHHGYVKSRRASRGEEGAPPTFEYLVHYHDGAEMWHNLDLLPWRLVAHSVPANYERYPPEKSPNGFS
jgi:hypothetical protein